ncbi:hypothetical protein [Pseudomonas amygdali]|nr:hypothetical protein [Pseudomonas amygdali]KPC17490.1 Uncharacterized protein AC499_0692 [Pseudomonas amygdali pv. lachrymans]
MTNNTFKIRTADVDALLSPKKSDFSNHTVLLVLGWLEEDKCESGMLIELREAYPELYQAHAQVLKGNPGNHMAGKIQACTALLLGTEHHERVMAVAIKGKVRIDLFARANASDYAQSFVRKVDGSLYTNAELKRLLRERLSIDALLLSVARHNDVEAYKQLIKIKPVAARASIKSIMEFASKHRVMVPNSFMGGLRESENPAGTAGVDINDYVGAFKGSGTESLAGMLEDYYQPALTPLVGHELFHSLFARDVFRDSPENRDYVAKLMRDGGDWYIGLKQCQEGSHAYLGLLTRKKDPKAELQALIGHGAKTANQPLVGEILKHIPVELIVEYADTPAKADQIYRIVRLECIKNKVSKKLHDKNFGADLGL